MSTHNKLQHNRTQACSDCQNAARFVSPCARRYMHMRITGLVLAFTFALPINAGNPEYCTGALAHIVSKLESKGLLQKPSGIQPDKNYMPDESYELEDSPQLCISRTDKEYNWIVHKHKDGVTVLIQRYEFDTSKSLYYGPFKSAYNK